jgi:hypothetical protein
MSDKAAKMISAGLFALALSYFLTNMREVHRLSDYQYIVLNKLTGSVYLCYRNGGCAERPVEEETE